MVIVGHFLYVAADDHVTVLNIADPFNVTIASFIEDSVYLDEAMGIVLASDHIFVVGYAGVTAVHIADPYNITIASSIIDYNLFNRPGDIAIVGEFAYVLSDWQAGLWKIINISDPTSALQSPSTAVRRS